MSIKVLRLIRAIARCNRQRFFGLF